MFMKYAPIALFVYKRPEHTRKTLEALMQCPEFEDSELYVFSDAEKKIEDEKLVLETRNLVKSMLGEKAKIVEAEKNQGLAKSIISGVNSLLEDYDRVIVLEDDLLVSPRFLSYMNAALETYQNETSVMQVSGYMFPIKKFADQTDALFLPFTTSWGWGTWRRAWLYFDPDATGWEALKTDSAMRFKFNLDGAYDYSDMLNTQMSRGADSWAIRWYWSVFQNRGYVLYPPVSHVHNIGLDGSGTHGSFTGKTFQITKKDINLQIVPEKLPRLIQIKSNNYKTIINWIKKNNYSWQLIIKKSLSFYLNFIFFIKNIINSSRV